VLTPLDSTIRANWTASSDPRTVRYAFSTWDGGTLVGTKIVAGNSPAADANGLQTGHAYLIQLQAVDSAGNLSNPVTATATTDAQPPLANVAFLTLQRQPRRRPRPEPLRRAHPLDGGRHRRRARLEAGLPLGAPLAHAAHREPGAGGRPGAPARAGRLHEPQADHRVRGGLVIGINVDQPITSDPGESDVTIPLFFQGPSTRYTAPNVRVPIVAKLSQTSAQLFINGTLAVNATGFSLPWSRGHLLPLHKNYRTGVIDAEPTTPKEVLQLLHWDVVQFDGPAGSYNPVVRAYIQPGCRGTVYVYSQGFRTCPSFLDFAHPSPAAVNISIPDDVSKISSAKLLFNGAFTSPLGVSLNGHPLTTFPATAGSVESNLLSYDLSPAQVPFLVSGTNTFIFTGNGVQFPGLTQFELEVVYNVPRTNTNPRLMPMPMLNFTDQNVRLDCLLNDPNPVKVATTFLYSFGSAPPVNCTLSPVFPTPQPPWLQVLSPLSGTVSPLVLGGALVPVQIQVDCNQLRRATRAARRTTNCSGSSSPASPTRPSTCRSRRPPPSARPARSSCRRTRPRSR
jgi:hypothetical protein